MGRHSDAGRRRGIARWLIAAVVVVLVLAGATVGYIIVVGRSNTAADGACTGTASLPVVAGAGAGPAVQAAATAYNATKPVARSTCVTATVTSLPDSAVLAGLTKGWPGKDGPAPGLWVPDSAASLTALDASRPDLAAGHPTDPTAWSPVVLAVRSDDVAAVAALAWSDLPGAAGPDGTAALPGGEHLLLALPPIDGNRATSYALQSILAGGTRSTALRDSDVRADSLALKDIGSATVGSPATTLDALAALTAGTGPANAVPVVEADLVGFDKAGGKLAAVHPSGPTVGDTLIAAPITATWVNPAMAAAASSFQAYLASAPGQQILADHGWRASATPPADPLPDVNTTTTVTRLPAGGPGVDDALAKELGQPLPPPAPTTSASGSSTSTAAPTTPPSTTPSPTTPTTTPPTTGATTTPPPTTTTASTTANPAARGPVLTIIVDSSVGMAQTTGGKSLLAWVQQALPTVTGGTVTDRVGLWAYSDSGALPPDGYPELVSTGPLSGKVGDSTRSQALASAIKGLTPDGDRWAYGAVIEALKKVPQAAVAGRPSRIVLITSGVDQTPGTPRRMVLDAEAAAHGKVRIDVIGLGGAVPVQAYQEVAKAAGGTYVPVPDPAKLGRALADLLTPPD